ncbi:MAG TPA: SRPBCC family protein, partial [Methylomirabilota bacterium]|nr:SRPBCC family protein [Methylomirabilota bacterium]
FTFLVLLALILLMVAIGLLLPKAHVATRRASFHQRPEDVWKAITDIDAMPSWREDVKSVQRLPDRNGLPAWIEKNGSDSLPLQTVTCQPPQRLVVRIADPSLPYGGTWTYELASSPVGAVLRITENGEVKNPLFRFLSRFVFGHTAKMETYLKGLAKKFGEPPQVTE